ncbi:MAG: YebC/PmpR family DNA-binding transcriptional regulator [Planctomycetaceae bacterium]
MGRDFENRKHAIFKTAAQKSKLYSKYGKQLYAAAKNGVPDPEGNPSLRSLIEKAKKDQVPAHVIEKAIQKASGVGGEDYSPARYEGVGPGGCMVIVDCLTDNNTRTIAEVRNCFTKTGSKLGTSGSATLWFDQLAILSFKADDEEEVLEALLMAEVEVDDINSKNGMVTVFTPPAEFFKAKSAIAEAFPEAELEVQEISFLPQHKKEVGPDDLPMFEKFIDMLNECDDVQEIYHNAELPVSDEAEDA